VLRQIVDNLAGRPEVAGVAVVSGDGLVIEQRFPPGTDAEALAALATTLARSATELGSTSTLGGFSAAVFEFAGGPVVISALGDGVALLVLARPDTDLGELLFTLRRERGSLAAQL